MLEAFTPKEIVDRLDRYIIGQAKAKRSVAIALRNRWRRQQVPEALREEITPKNIIMIGPTGVGKTEIARRIAKLAKAPFIKVEATKFTEVGYVGKDVESIIRDLVQIGVNLVKSEEKKRLFHKAEEFAEERLLDILLPPTLRNIKRKPNQLAAEIRIRPDELSNRGLSGSFHPMQQNGATQARTLTAEEQTRQAKQLEEEAASYQKSREKLRKMLHEGKLDERDVEIETREKNMPSIEIFSAAGAGEMDMNMREALGNFFPKRRKRRKVKVGDAKEILTNEEVSRLIDMEKVSKEAIYRVEQAGIVFLDEIDKIASRETKGGPDVSREGVQRDLLPIIEGSSVATKYGMVKTDHILFIASGAFHVSKPSDLIPEMQGRFPIRVELDRLTKEDFMRILKEPENSLTKQYVEMMKTEEVYIQFDPSAIAEISRVAEYVNEKTENIGARRLHTVMEKLFEEISFDAPILKNQTIEINEKYVKDRLEDLIADEDLSRYIL